MLKEEFGSRPLYAKTYQEVVATYRQQNGYLGGVFNIQLTFVAWAESYSVPKVMC